MKKRILICVSLLLVVVCLIGVYAVQSSKIVGEEGLIAKARKEISNLAEVETIEMTIAGKSTIENNSIYFGLLQETNTKCTDTILLKLSRLRMKNTNLFACTMVALKEGKTYSLNTLAVATRLL